MPVCTFKKKKKRNVCIGDMRDEIVIQSRNLKSPIFDGVDFIEDFQGKMTMWSLIETVSGVTVFDGAGTERDVTHLIFIRFLPGITSEEWILFNNERFDIIDSSDFDERHAFTVLRCSNTGNDINNANML